MLLVRACASSMSAGWWQAWAGRWRRAEEQLRERWVREDISKVQKWGYECEEEKWAWEAVLQWEVDALWAEAWVEAEAEDRQRRLELALLELG